MDMDDVVGWVCWTLLALLPVVLYFGGDMTAFDWLCVALAVSVTLNLIFIGRIGHLWRVIMGANEVLQAIADNKVRIARKPDGRWTAEKLQGE